MENANEIILLMRDKNKRQIARDYRFERIPAGRINRDGDAFRIFLLAESIALVWNTSIYGTPDECKRDLNILSARMRADHEFFRASDVAANYFQHRGLCRLSGGRSVRKNIFAGSFAASYSHSSDYEGAGGERSVNFDKKFVPVTLRHLAGNLLG